MIQNGNTYGSDRLLELPGQFDISPPRGRVTRRLVMGQDHR